MSIFWVRIGQSIEYFLRSLARIAGWPSFIVAPILIYIYSDPYRIHPLADPVFTQKLFWVGIVWMILGPIGLVWYKRTRSPGLRDIARRRAKHPSEPWHWNDQWVEGIVDDDGGIASTTDFGFFCFLSYLGFRLTVDVVDGWYRYIFLGAELDIGYHLFWTLLAFFALMFAVISTGRILHTLWNWLHPGRYRLRLKEFPIVSSTLRGEISLPFNWMNPSGLQLVLSCERDLDELWLYRHDITNEIVRLDDKTAIVPVSVELPKGLPDASPTWEDVEKELLVWQVSIEHTKSKNPLHVFEVKFPLPVFRDHRVGHGVAEFQSDVAQGDNVEMIRDHATAPESMS